MALQKLLEGPLLSKIFVDPKTYKVGIQVIYLEVMTSFMAETWLFVETLCIESCNKVHIHLSLHASALLSSKFGPTRNSAHNFIATFAGRRVKEKMAKSASIESIKCLNNFKRAH